MLITPIYDRTSSDVSYLQSLHDKIISSGFDSLTQYEKAFWLNGEQVNLLASDGQLVTSDDFNLTVGNSIIKGSMNITDLNRIESNTNALAIILDSYGYNITLTVKTDWQISDLFTLEELNRIRYNVDALQNIFITLSEWIPIEYVNTMDYVKTNALEWNIYQIDRYLEFMISSFWYSGEIYSGEGY